MPGLNAHIHSLRFYDCLWLLSLTVLLFYCVVCCAPGRFEPIIASAAQSINRKAAAPSRLSQSVRDVMIESVKEMG